jgi:membrane-associated phospholipid phosphatase
MASDSADVSVGVAAPQAPRAVLLRGRPPARRVTATDPRRGGPATRFAEFLDGRHPAVVFAAAEILGYVALVAVTIGLGLLLTHVVLPFHGIGNADERPVAWLAARRTPFLTDASLVGSMIGDYVLVGLVVVLSVTLAALRHWRIAAFVALALIAESATYGVTVLIVHRHRPEVTRLDHLAANASYPSGHVAASVAVYGGLALLIASRVRNAALRAGCWAIAAALPLFVAFSRMYRGMHHPLDMAAGALMGTAAVMIALFAARASGAAVERRRRRTP